MVRTLSTGLAVLAPALLALACAASADSNRPHSPVAISAKPRLIPGFRANVHDYVSRCNEAGLSIHVKAQDGTAVRLDGRRVGRDSKHELPLAAGEGTTISGTARGHRVEYRVRCLPHDFPKWTVRGSGRTQASGYLALPEKLKPKHAYATIFDGHGVPIWWLRAPGHPFDAELLPKGRVAWAQRKELSLATTSHPYEIRTLDGLPAGEVQGSGMVTDFHELRPLANGDFLVVGTTPRGGVDLRPYGGPANATVLDGVVQEVTPQGKVTWSWTSRGHIPLSATRRWYKLSVLKEHETLPGGTPAYDLVHLNSAEPDGNQILISSRHTDAIYAIDRSTGRIAWKLGGTRSPQSLRLVGGGNAKRLFGGQHDARVAPDGTLTVHDNASSLRRPPAALRIAVDPAKRTARVVERVSDPDIRFAGCCGSARKLPGGHWVISWGYSPRFAELTATGKKVLELRFTAFVFSYRVTPIMPGQLSATTLRRAMDAMAARARGKR